MGNRTSSRELTGLRLLPRRTTTAVATDRDCCCDGPRLLPRRTTTAVATDRGCCCNGPRLLPTTDYELTTNSPRSKVIVIVRRWIEAEEEGRKKLRSDLFVYVNYLVLNGTLTRSPSSIAIEEVYFMPFWQEGN